MKTFLILLLFPLLSFSKQLHIMSYNVQNLFDTTHDKYRNEKGQLVDQDDYEYLPFGYPGKTEGCYAKTSSRYKKICLSQDWTPKRLELKVNQIADIITCTKIERDANGKLIRVCDKKKPDVLALTEVENEKVLRLLQKRLGYTGLLIAKKGSDHRGIDVALLYSGNKTFKYVTHTDYSINPFLANTNDKDLGPLRGKYLRTRSMLEALFMVNGREKLYVYVNHWPSQSPRHLDIERSAFAKMLLQKVYGRLSRDPRAYAVSLGDYNVIDDDDYPHSFREIILNKKISRFVDAHDVYMRDPNIPHANKLSMPPGTYYYIPERKWNLLDRVFMESRLLKRNSPLRVDFSDGYYYNIIAPAFARYKRKYGPLYYRFNELNPELAGYSDHFPVEFKLTY